MEMMNELNRGDDGSGTGRMLIIRRNGQCKVMWV